MGAWKPRLLLVVLVLAGGVIGFVIGRGSASAPGIGDTAPPRDSPDGVDARPSIDELELAKLRRENAELRARLERLGHTAAPGTRVLETGVPGFRLRVTDETGDTTSGTLLVAIVNEEGQPRAGLRVNARMPGSKQAVVPEGTTGPDGLVSFSDLAPGRHSVTVFLPLGHRSVTVLVEAGETREARIELPTGGVVSGVVRHADAGPVSGAFVGLYRSEPGREYVQLRTRSDEAGGYRLEGVPPGPYSLSVSCPGEARTSGRTRTTITVAAGESLRHDILVGVPKLQGTVRDATTGLPIPRVSLRIQFPIRGEAISGADGTYRFVDLRPAKITLVVTRDGYGLRFLRDVEVSEEGTRLDLELTPAATVTFRLTLANGEPVVGRVSFGMSPVVKGEGTNVGTSITADEEGRATYRRIVPGHYRLHFSAGEAKGELTVRVAPGENTLEVSLE